MLMIHIKQTSVLERAVTFSTRIKIISKKSVVHGISSQLSIFSISDNYVDEQQLVNTSTKKLTESKRMQQVQKMYIHACYRHSFNEVNEFPQISTCWNFPKMRKQPKYITYQRYPTFSITMLMRFIDISAVLSLAANIMKSRIYFDFKAFIPKKPSMVHFQERITIIFTGFFIVFQVLLLDEIICTLYVSTGSCIVHFTELAFF